jgi:hypothetical protein
MADMKNHGNRESEQVKHVTEEYRNLLHEAMLLSEYYYYYYTFHRSNYYPIGLDIKFVHRMSYINDHMQYNINIQY